MPLSEHCTFRIGGPAEYFVLLSSTKNLPQTLEFCYEENIPVTVIGSGSNVLFPDEGLHGLVIKIALREFSFHDETMTVQAGMPLPKLAKIIAERGLSGLEFSSGIPGTIGGAVIINAGFKEWCMGDIVRKVSGYQLTGGKFSIDHEQLNFKYRSSSLRNMKKLITETVLKLRWDDTQKIRKRMADFNDERKSAQPLEYPSAGSIFKNPPDKPAWKLIEDAGCKGLRIGNAQVSEKHGNFIINLGDAAYSDVRNIIDTVIERVYDTSGIMLDLELLDMGKSPQRKKEAL